MFEGLEILLPFIYSNTIVQLAIFLIIAIPPVIIHRRMYFVDVAWPAGLTAIGLNLIFFYTEGNSARRYLIGAVYLFHGGRMFAGAVTLVVSGQWSVKKPDLPRYQYAVLHFEKDGKNVLFAMLQDVMTQCGANIWLMCMPGLILGSSQDSISLVQIIGVSFWGLFYILENVADGQMLAFRMRKNKKKGECCMDGMWAYHRHPNYFFEWMTWNALMVTGMISLWDGSSAQYSLVIRLILSVTVFGLCPMMYYCLVHWTGSEPAEYFSVQHRPAYKDYQKQVPMFFPSYLLKCFGIKYKQD